MATSRHLWTRDLLHRLGVPGSYYNALAIISQAQAEGGSAKFNPLNTTREAPGATDYNSVHVKNYTSYEQGLTATVATFQQANMKPLMTALKSGKSSAAYWTALGLTPWGTRPPAGVTTETFLQDIRRHWFERSMLPISGT